MYFRAILPVIPSDMSVPPVIYSYLYLVFGHVAADLGRVGGQRWQDRLDFPAVPLREVPLVVLLDDPLCDLLVEGQIREVLLNVRPVHFLRCKDEVLGLVGKDDRLPEDVLAAPEHGRNGKDRIFRRRICGLVSIIPTCVR